MIEIKELTKIYQSRKGGTCLALDRVSFILPDKGLVFIIGKSGSGKSMLLNLMGGLDEVTSGEIVVDGVKFSEMKGADGFDAFRNSYMGFVFQDYYLLEECTAVDNVRLVLDLKKEHDDDRVNEVLALLGIGDLAQRRPKELSGGQQQRVAIARAIVKDPSLILADEPTGNLDERSATQILEILKDLSKDRLVLVVSHNLENAKKYGDRIIRLERGRVVSDVSRSDVLKNELEIKEDEIVLPNGTELTEAELEKINEKVRAGSVKISQQKPAFVQTVAGEPAAGRARPQFFPSRLSAKKIGVFAAKFTRLSLFPFLASTLIVSFLLVVFGICQALYLYDANALLQDTLPSDRELVVLQKAYQTDEIFKVAKTDKLNRVTQQDLDAFRESGYTGNMYLLYNDAIIFGNKTNLETYKPIDQSTEYSQFYAAQAFGTLRCDEQYLRKIFGNGAALSYYGDPYALPYGVVITDYMADCILYYNEAFRSHSQEDPYENLLNAKVCGRFVVNAVIRTNYRETYQALREKFSMISTAEDQKSYAKSVYLSEDFLRFTDEARLKLNLAYALSDDYFEQTRYLPKETRHFVRFPKLEVLDAQGKVQYVSDDGTKYSYVDDSLQDDEITIKESLFNEVYPNETFDADKTYQITLRMYDVASREGDLPCAEKTFRIKALQNDMSLIKVNLNTFAEFRKYDIIPYAILFDDADDAMRIHEIGEQNMFVSNSPQILSALTIANAIGMYQDVFLILAIVLAVAGFLILVNFGHKNVRSRTYEIGVIRALGARKSEVIKIFLLQMLVACLAICVVSTCGMFVMMGSVNQILTAGLVRIAKNPFFDGLKLLTFDPLNFLIILATVILISLAAFVVPLIMLNRIKPINIIKNRE